MFRPFLNGSDESEWDDVVGESAFPITLPPHRHSLLIQAIPFHYVRLIDFNAYVLRPSYNHLIYCMMPNIFGTYFTKKNFAFFKWFLRLFCVLLLLFCKSIELNIRKHFTMEVAFYFRDSDVFTVVWVSITTIKPYFLRAKVCLLELAAYSNQ
jgi:hypothetical protein